MRLSLYQLEYAFLDSFLPAYFFLFVFYLLPALVASCQLLCSDTRMIFNQYSEPFVSNFRLRMLLSFLSLNLPYTRFLKFRAILSFIIMILLILWHDLFRIVF